MTLPRWHTIFGLTALLAVAPAAWAQNSPRIGYAYPAGGRQGTTFQVTVGGQYLTGVAGVYVSGTGVRATVIEHNKPLTQRQFSELRDKLKELQDKKRAATGSPARRSGPSASQPATRPTWTTEDEKILAEVRKKLLNAPKRQANPAIAETVTLQVTLAPNTQPGQRDLRLGTPQGLSNPLTFCVGQVPEFTEKEPKTSTAEEMSITLPATVNGQIMPGDVDRFRFKARKGQRLVVEVSARRLIPYLADAVPGWFQATVALYDAAGNEVAYADDYRFHPDPVLYHEIPDDGEYVIAIKDSIYRGREDFVYRITLGELPFVTSIFPLGGKAGTQTTVQLTGWNLPIKTLTPTPKEPGILPLSVRARGHLSNQVPFAADTLPERLEVEPNNHPGSAQAATLPLVMNGHIDRPGDWDIFRFEGSAGSQIVAEIDARRLNSPLDSVLKLTDATGQQLAANDDHDDKGAGLHTHHADSRLCATLPANGTYYLHLGDAQGKGGFEYGYRLRITPPQPDFELRIVPSTINIRPGATIPITVYALRKDGFSGDIELALKKAPAGFTLSGNWVPANQDQVRLTLTVPPASPKEPVTLNLEGRATIQGRQVTRPAVPAEDMMQAFAYRHLVPARELMLAVSGRPGARASMKILDPTPIKIPAGGTARFQAAARRGLPAASIQLELSDPPSGISIQSTSPSDNGLATVLHCDAAKVKPGLKGNLIITAYATRPSAAGTKAQGNKGRQPLGTLPAIPFEIVAQ